MIREMRTQTQREPSSLLKNKETELKTGGKRDIMRVSVVTIRQKEQRIYSYPLCENTRWGNNVLSGNTTIHTGLCWYTDCPRQGDVEADNTNTLSPSLSSVKGMRNWFIYIHNITMLWEKAVSSLTTYIRGSALNKRSAKNSYKYMYQFKRKQMVQNILYIYSLMLHLWR
jgi:hypothetical protein